MAGLLYLDASALVKLVLPEAESNALVGYLAGATEYVSSAIAAVEVVRAARRASGDPAVARRAREVLAGVHLLRISEANLDAAARIEPKGLRALDAIHLATALRLGSDLEAMVVYDRTLAEAASRAGIEVVSP